MKDLKLQTTSDSWIIRALFIGSILIIGIGFGYLLTVQMYDEEIDLQLLFHMFTTGLLFLSFSISEMKKYIVIDHRGIQTGPNPNVKDYPEIIKWTLTTSIYLTRRKIKVDKSDSYTEKITLPLLTIEQWTELESYLSEICKENSIHFESKVPSSSRKSSVSTA